jgi:hypothetical protein
VSHVVGDGARLLAVGGGIEAGAVALAADAAVAGTDVRIALLDMERAEARRRRAAAHEAGEAAGAARISAAATARRAAAWAATRILRVRHVLVCGWDDGSGAVTAPGGFFTLTAFRPVDAGEAIAPAVGLVDAAGALALAPSDRAGVRDAGGGARRTHAELVAVFARVPRAWMEAGGGSVPPLPPPLQPGAPDAAARAAVVGTQEAADGLRVALQAECLRQVMRDAAAGGTLDPGVYARLEAAFLELVGAA